MIGHGYGFKLGVKGRYHPISDERQLARELADLHRSGQRDVRVKVRTSLTRDRELRGPEVNAVCELTEAELSAGAGE